MRILLLAPHPFFQHRGTPLAEKALLGVLARRGYQLDVLTFHEGEELDIPNCHIHRIPHLPGVRNVRPGFSWKKIVCDTFLLFKCIRMVRAARYDLIHAVEESAFIAVLVNRLYGVPFVYDMDSSLAAQMMEKYPALRTIRFVLEASERLAIRKSIGVLAVCKSLEQLAIRHAPHKRVARVEDMSLVSPNGSAEDLAEIVGQEGPYVMYVGNLEAYQGIDLLLQGVREARRQRPDLQLVVIGGAPADIRRYQEQARALGIGDNAHFIGPRPVATLGAYLRQADVLVSPRAQGVNTPMKIYSYLDSGRPLLATRLPTHTQVLDEHISYLVEPTPIAIGRGLATLLEDESLRARLASNAKNRVQQEFSPAAFARKIDAFYDLLEQDLRLQQPRPSST